MRRRGRRKMRRRRRRGYNLYRRLQRREEPT